MQQSAGGLTLWTEGTTVDGKRKSVRSLTWEKQAKAQSHCCGPSVYCYCPMAKSRASKSMGPADRKVRWDCRVCGGVQRRRTRIVHARDRKSTRLNSSHSSIS